jgi:3-oxoacyl-[acyl-carrier-protein] synthase III
MPSLSTIRAFIKAIEYFFPTSILNNDQLASEFGIWSAEKVESKTGIQNRYIAGQDECASDLAFNAAQKLFSRRIIAKENIDFLLFCTQSPDYFLPTTACILQSRLGLPKSCGALDYNLGCSGFVYGLGLAKGLIESGQARNVLLITAETYSKFLHPQDRGVRTLFGDAATATFVSSMEHDQPLLGPFVYGTDGTGAQNLIVPTGGMRKPSVLNPELIEDKDGNKRTINNLYMNGPEIFNFTLKAVPQSVHQLLDISGKRLEEIDFFVFHQANKYMLEYLRKKIGIPNEKFCMSIADCGNTVSSTIPIALDALWRNGRLQPGNLLMLVGFGVGYSWAATLVRWIAQPPV